TRSSPNGRRSTRRAEAIVELADHAGGDGLGAGLVDQKEAAERAGAGVGLGEDRLGQREVQAARVGGGEVGGRRGGAGGWGGGAGAVVASVGCTIASTTARTRRVVCLTVRRAPGTKGRVDSQHTSTESSVDAGGASAAAARRSPRPMSRSSCRCSTTDSP